LYAVILAGGGGTRLWPLSQPERPKPFLPLLGEETLIQRTVARLAPLIAPRDVYVIAERRHIPLAAAQLPAVPPANLIAEPVGRNTAAAVALAAESIPRAEDEVMVVLPADGWIADEAGFRAALATAGEIAAAGGGGVATGAGVGPASPGRLVTLGVSPDRAETGYGYILARPPAREVAGRPVFDVERFVEKPTVDKAVELVATGLASWNAGIFVWTRAAIRSHLARHAPDIDGAIRAICESGHASDLETAYPLIRATSIDYAVMEPASLEGAVAVVPMDVGWSDVGSWAALRDAWEVRAAHDATTADRAIPAGAVGRGNRMDLGSSGTLVMAGDRLVVTIGLKDVIVVDTPEALLVCAADRSQDVRTIHQQLVDAALGPVSPAPSTSRKDQP
jgi:mannose-1-phosphate guanylyltransferase/mannose-6-phosphate isomerase